jgi:hypothetical protein
MPAFKFIIILTLNIKFNAPLCIETCFSHSSVILLCCRQVQVGCYPTKICSFSGDGEEDEVQGETEPMASSQQHEQQDGESRGERSHLIVWQVTMQD